jgi:hypothetical protein
MVKYPQRSHTKSLLYGVFVWVHGALNSQKRRCSTWAGWASHRTVYTNKRIKLLGVGQGPFNHRSITADHYDLVAFPMS